NMDTELFMECEEEELEPWQQVDDSVEEDEMDFMDNYGEPGETYNTCCSTRSCSVEEETMRGSACRYCYRQFSSPAQLQSHQEQVHGPTLSSCMCRICEWAQTTKPGEMPYVCQVCSYRSSFYSDVLQHFASFHRESRFLLCVFCLKVTRNPVSYQQHLLPTPGNRPAFHCNRCRLQFIFLKDKMQHKLESHRSFRRPAQLEGLPPGSKVNRGAEVANPEEATDQSAAPESTRCSVRCFLRGTIPSPCRSGDSDQAVCLECGTEASDFSAHYPTHVHCLLCPYSSCCSRAYAAHMIHVFLLRCSQCDFRPQTADQMADHLLENPDHHSATCYPRSKTVDSVDQTMAPVEEFSDDEKLDDMDDIEESDAIKEEFIQEGRSLESHLPSTTNTHAQPAAILPGSKEREDFLSARQLRIALFALCDGLRQASRVFSTETQQIRSWLKEARNRLKQTVQEVHSDGEDRMVAWVLSMREQQLPITESNLFRKVSMLKKKRGFGDNFRISYIWAVSFLLQRRLGVRTAGRAASLGRILPSSLDTKVLSFREFTQKVFCGHKLTESSVATMDELCLFVDVRLAQDKSRCSEALEFTGSSPLVTVYLSALADGTMLPSLVLANHQVALKTLQEFIMVETSPEGLLVEEALALWTNKVWLQNQSGLARKSMLVLDRHREHLGDQFITAVSGSGTLPAVIPGGCSFCLQPLEVCLKPVLQRYLLACWSKFTERNPKELDEMLPRQLQANVAQLLVDWVVEALTHLNKHPQLLKKSFDLTELLPRSRDDDNKTKEDEMMSQKPEEVQSDLLKTLTEILLGAEQVDSPDLLELEDEEDEEEGQETTEETTEEAQNKEDV
uniref:Pogo transposable element derived with ZNF domain b n=1 Tax=Amphiprion percula TaxID=161767 RepID=A0A3P8T1M9_AMPPE